MNGIDNTGISLMLKSNTVLIGVNIRKFRKGAGLTQQDVAFFIDSDKSVICSLERGTRNNVTLCTLIKIANVLHVDLKELLSDGS